MTAPATRDPDRAPLSLKAKAAIACAAVAIAAVSGAAIAYLTDTDGVENVFSLASPLDIEIIEAIWDSKPDENSNDIPDHAEEIAPNQTVEKDPAVRNNDGTDAWVFLEVSIPTRVVSVVEDDGGLSDPARTELFSFSPKSNWSQMGDIVYDDEHQTATHYYGYTAELSPGSTTNPLFTEVTLANIADGQLDAQAADHTACYSINAKAYGIQTEGFESHRDAWDALVAQGSAPASA